MTDEETAIERHIRIARMGVPEDFEVNEVEPRVLNARYDATKNNRWIQEKTDILPNGTYRYKTQNLEHSQSTDYVPAPVATNPMIALKELDRQDLLQLTISYDADRKYWKAQASLNAGAYNSFRVRNPDINQAVARAIMSVISQNMFWQDIPDV